MEKVRKVSKRLYLRQFITYWLACWMFIGLPTQIAMAAPSLPSGENVVHGGAGISFDRGTTDQLHIRDVAHETIIEWDSFDIGSGALTEFHQIGTNPAVLNRVCEGDASLIYGTLTANGRVFVVNPAGIVFGDGAELNVPLLVASALGMSDNDFLTAVNNANEKMVFGDITGEIGNDVINLGKLDAEDTGSLYLVGQNILNSGEIYCPDGLVVMAAGNAVKLGQPGSPTIVDLADFTLSSDYTDNRVTAGGATQAKDIALGAGDIWASALTATANGSASIVAKSKGNVKIDGDILANAFAGSDAVATIDIIAGYDVTIDAAIDTADVSAEAVGNGVDNANATVTVKADKNVYVKDGFLGALAVTDDKSSLTSGNLIATVDIDAGRDVVTGGDGDPGYIAAVAKTADGATGDLGDITATVDIDAGKIDVLEGNVAAIAKTGLESYVNAGNITATVDIDALGYSAGNDLPSNDGDVHVNSDDFYVEDLDITVSSIEAHAEAGSGILGTAGDITATVDIDAAGMLDVDGGGIQAEATVGYQEFGETGNLDATVDILTGGDVYVTNGYIEALARKGLISREPDVKSPASIGDSTATVNIDSGGNVEVIAKDGAEAKILAKALDGSVNTTGVTINATGAQGTEQGDMIEEPVHDDYMMVEPGVYEVDTYVEGGNVEVTAYNGHAGIAAEAVDATDNTAGVEINADDTVVVMDQAGAQTAEIIARAEQAYSSNTADVLINANNVLAIATEYGRARIKAKASGIMEPPYYPVQTLSVGPYIPEADGTTNNASVEINTNASELEDPYGVADCIDYLLGDYENPQLDEFLGGLVQGGHVVVGSVHGGDAEIMAKTSGHGGTANTSDVLICADGGVLVGDLECSGDNGKAEIKALAENGYSNTSDVGIAAPLGLGVLALGDYAKASIASKAKYGCYNQADLVACTEGPALVLGIYNSDDNYGARIESAAKYGYCEGPYESSAYTDICAGEDVIVGALEGEAFISSKGQGYRPFRPTPEPPSPDGGTVVTLQDIPEYPEEELPPTTADAETLVVSKRGIVGLIDYDNSQVGTAGITSEAYGAELNNAYTGVLAGAELSPDAVFSDEPPLTLLSSLLYDFGDDLNSMLELDFDILDYFVPGSVYVAAFGYDGHAMILSEASNGLENTAETVVAAPGQVLVINEGGNHQPLSQIKSRAGWFDDEGSLNNATTRIYASEVEVDVQGLYRGNGVWAYAAGLTPEGSPEDITPPHVPYRGDEENGYDPDPDDDGDLEFLMTEYDSTYGTGEAIWTEENEETGTYATLILQYYSERTDLPACPECPCQEDIPDEPPVGPPAPLGVAPLPALEDIDFGQGGCPALMAWLANEVGVQVDIQVFLAGAFVSSTDCQPCESAAKLKRAATILADEDGSHIAAMNQVFTELANTLTLNAPFTPEMASSVAAAFADPANTGAQYALAREYIDAFVQYIAVLNNEMGSPVGDSIAYVMAKYGSDVEGNAMMAAFLASRLESGETFAQ